MGVGGTAVAVGTAVGAADGVAVGASVAVDETVAVGTMRAAGGEGTSGVTIPGTLHPTKLSTTHIVVHQETMILDIDFTVEFLHISTDAKWHRYDKRNRNTAPS